MLPANTPDILRAAGLRVVEIKGWQTRGRPGSHNPVGVLNHHTAASARLWTAAKRLAYAVWMMVTGRSDLAAPLCQFGLGPDGTVYLGAAGRANHAGTAKASGSVGAGDGNTLYIGVEWMLSGTETIPAVMMEAGITLNAVLTEHMTKTSVQTISCHYNTSVTGKWDIGDPNGVPFKNVKVLDIPKFRAAVASKRASLYRQETPVPDKNKTKRKVVGLSWNMYTGRKSLVVRGELAALIKDNAKPKFVALQEARGYRRIIRLVALALGYKVFQPSGATKEDGSTALLVKNGTKVKASGVLRLRKGWTWYSKPGRKGRAVPHSGRVFPWVVIPIDGVDTFVTAVHFPLDKHNPKSKGAWDETLSEIEVLAQKHGAADIVIGDFNDKHTAVDNRSPRALAKRMGARVVRTPRPAEAWIDYALVKGHKATLETGNKRGSNHKPIRLFIEKD